MSMPDAYGKPTPEGLFVTLDELNYAYQPIQTPADRPHLFTYHLTVHNRSALTVTLLARKWIITYEDGQMDIIEGDKLVGKTPSLAPGKAFSYASFHLIGGSAEARGGLHGVDENGQPIYVALPSFQMSVPGGNPCN